MQVHSSISVSPYTSLAVQSTIHCTFLNICLPLNVSYPPIHNTLYIPQYLSPLKLLLPFNTQYIVHSSISVSTQTFLTLQYTIHCTFLNICLPLNFSYPPIHNTLYIPQYLSPLKLLLPSNTQYIVHSSISFSP